MKAQESETLRWSWIVLTLGLLLAAPMASAKPKQWKMAKVLDAVTAQTGTVAVVVPSVGGGVIGAAAPIAPTAYWLETDEFRYLVPDRSKGFFVQWWLRAPIGGTVKVAEDSGDPDKVLWVIDDRGKPRKFQNLQKRLLKK